MPAYNFSAYQVADPQQEPDRWRPHSNLPAGQEPQALNGAKGFVSSGDTSSDEESDGTGERHAPPVNTESLVVCRHLSLYYVSRSLVDPRHQPQAGDIKGVRRMPQEKLEVPLRNLRHSSRALHLVCAQDFGVFLRQCFNEMRRGKVAVRVEGHPGLQARRIYFIDTGSHLMALRLAVWKSPSGGPDEHEVTVYDPNSTDQQVQAFVTDLHDFRAHPHDHHLLSYIVGDDMSESSWREMVAEYFDMRQNQAMQTMLFELDIDGPEEQSSPPDTVSTDWSASPRATLYLAKGAAFDSLTDQALADYMDHADQTQDPGLLMNLPSFDSALLVPLMRRPPAHPMQQWRRLWESADDDMKEALLCAYDGECRPLGFLRGLVNPDCLAGWVEMLKTLPPKRALGVLKAQDPTGDSALSRALRSHEVLQALDPLLKEWGPTLGQEIGQLLANKDKQGCSALRHVQPSWDIKALHLWMTWLEKWTPPEQRVDLLHAPDDAGVPALARAIAANASEWVAAWVEALGTLTPEGARQVLDARAQDGTPAIWLLAQHQHAPTLIAWLGGLKVIPPEQRQAVLAGYAPKGPDKTSRPALVAAMTADSIRPDYVDAWAKALSALPEEDCVSLLQAWDELGQGALLHAIRAGKAEGVQAWGQWVSVLPAERHHEVLSGRDRQGAGLLAQPWCERYPIIDGTRYLERSDLVEKQHDALNAWIGLLGPLSIDRKMALLAGHDASGEPAWVVMGREGLISETHMLFDILNENIPPEHRQAMGLHLGFADEAAQARFLTELARDASLRQGINDSLRFAGPWLPPTLLASLRSVLAQN